jgi:hypothetical protein
MKAKKVFARITAALFIIWAIYFYVIKPAIEAGEKHGHGGILLYIAIYAILIYGAVRLAVWLIDNI